MRDAFLTLLTLPLVIAGLVAAAWLSPDRRAVDCVTGDAALNSTGEDGREVPRQEFFESLDDAEAFLCLDVPELGAAPGWQEYSINAIRSHSLAKIDSADGRFRYVELSYFNESLRAFIGITPYHPGVLEFPGLRAACEPPPLVDVQPIEVPVRVQGDDTTLYLVDSGRSPPRYSLCWERDGTVYFAGGTYQGNLDVRRVILPLLETVR